MREFGYPLARARRVRARRAAFGGSSVLLCAALALIFVAPDEVRRPGSSVAPTLDVTAAQAMAPVPLPRRPVALPSDRVMTASNDILGGGQAPDVWSTPVQAEPEPQVAEAAEVTETGPLASPELEAAILDEAPAPNMLFEHASLIDRQVDISAPSPAVAVPNGVAAPAPLSMRSLAGKWAAHPAACSSREKRTAYLPLTIDQRGAKAGGASCSFRRTAQDGNRWSVSATCTDAKESWDAHVRLVLAGNKLTWTSERGSQTYTRCR